MRILVRGLAGVLIFLAAWGIFWVASGAWAAASLVVAVVTAVLTTAVTIVSMYEIWLDGRHESDNPSSRAHGQRSRRPRCGSCRRRKTQVETFWLCERCDLAGFSTSTVGEGRTPPATGLPK